ncbi:ABC transporter permease, partial [bacterium]|nr:ABC transporter permease [bacterium]
MGFFLDSLISAFELIWSLDSELLIIVAVSLKVSGCSAFFASFFGIPLGFFISFNEFRGKRLVITSLNTMLALPTVAIALFIYTFISRRGIFGP